MIQEIIVFILFAAIIGFYLYRFFFQKNKKVKGGCEKCAEYKTPVSAEEKKKKIL